jgi:hypothetical protein
LAPREHTYRSARIKEAAMAIERDDQEPNQGVSRRGFLTGLGAGAAGAAGAVVLPPEVAAQSRPPDTRPDRFSRLFPTLDPFFKGMHLGRLNEVLREIGEPGGMMDAKDPLEAGPILLITEPARSPNNVDNTGNTAGTTFFGQFLDHDMTFDTTSRLGVPTQPERSPNARTPLFDLDTVYGGGPTTSPHLYQDRDKAKFVIGDNGVFEDLPRTRSATAIIPDPRNDENMMIAGIQVAMLMFHNAVVDRLRRDRDRREREDERRTFEQAREIVTWHYHWIILNEFLPQIVGANAVTDVFRSRNRFFKPDAGEQSIPVEFQLMYRFGHSLIRPSYRANLNGNSDGTAFFGFIFDPAGEGQPDPVDLRGGARAPRRFIGWQTFFNFGNVVRPRPVGGTLGPLSQDVRPNKLIDTRISTPLFNLPLGAIASGDLPTSLPQRNLLRHVTWSVPSGQAVAQALRIPVLSRNEFRDLAGFGIGLDRSTPLWFYILREAEVAGRAAGLPGGQKLAGMGARVIAEVFVGLLQADPNSFLNRNPRWRPTLPAAQPGTFRMIDLLTVAGVDPTSRGQ